MSDIFKFLLNKLSKKRAILEFFHFAKDSFFVNMKKDYGNKVSSFGLFTSKVFAESFKWGLTNLFNGIDKMMNE